MNAKGCLSAIFIKRSHGGVMDAADSATLVADRGVAGNADQGGRRQVTLLDRERWDRLTETAGRRLDPSARRANFVLEGIDLQDSRGRRLRVGEALLEIRGETKPCEQMDAALPGLKDLLWPDWGGGAYAQIMTGGFVRIGDEVRWDG